MFKLGCALTSCRTSIGSFMRTVVDTLKILHAILRYGYRGLQALARYNCSSTERATKSGLVNWQRGAAGQPLASWARYNYRGVSGYNAL